MVYLAIFHLATMDLHSNDSNAAALSLAAPQIDPVVTPPHVGGGLEPKSVNHAPIDSNV
jgi:hypothetical protein